ncbi:MAG: DUF1056 family protein [Bacteroidales bacterium]|nr:DUF1056 family protein [Bacteroidales bacterium]
MCSIKAAVSIEYSFYRFNHFLGMLIFSIILFLAEV